MSSAENKTLVRRYFEEAPHKPAVYDEILTNDFRVHAIHHATITPAGAENGPPAFKAFAIWLHLVWSDAAMTVDELIGEGDRVMARWTFRGVHTGELFGIPPTGKAVAYAGINIFRVAEGKLAESWDLFDRLWQWQQLGVLPDTAEFLAKAREKHSAPRVG